MPCRNPHLPNLSNHMLTRVMIQQLKIQPTKWCHVMIFIFPMRNPNFSFCTMEPPSTILTSTTVTNNASTHMHFELPFAFTTHHVARAAIAAADALSFPSQQPWMQFHETPVQHLKTQIQFREQPP